MSRDVQLSVVSVTVEVEFMMANDLTEGEHVDIEEKGALYGALRDTMGDG